MKAVSIKNLNFKYKDITVFNDLNLEIEKGTFTTILGRNAGGKTTLVNILLGRLKYKGEVLIPKEIGVVFEDFDLFERTPREELMHKLKGNSEDKVVKIAEEIGINKILNDDIETLSFGDKCLTALAVALVDEPQILILDSALETFDRDEKNKIIKLIKKKIKKNNMTVINLTCDSEEALLSDNVSIISNGQVILSESKKKFFENENILLENGLELPFIINLSSKLKFYGLLNKNYFDEKKMVKDLWK